MDFNEKIGQQCLFEDVNDDKLYNSLFTKKCSFTESQLDYIQKHTLNEDVEMANLDGFSDDIPFYNTPDTTIVIVDGYRTKLQWNDRNAITFIALSKDCIGYSNHSGENHDVVAINMAEDIPAKNHVGDGIPSGDEISSVLTKIRKNSIAYGRYWRDVDGYTIFSYWNTGERKAKCDLKSITEVICKEKEINPQTVYITNGDESIIKLTDSSAPMFHVDINKEKEALNLHQLPSDEKWNETSDFRNNRDKVIGQKLTKSDGSEMPMAQYNALRYVDESNNINESSNSVDPSKVLLVDRYLNNNFVRASMPIMGEDGEAKTLFIVGMKGTDGNILKNMTAKQLFYKLQDKFQKIFGDRDKRDKFLLQVMKDWYNHKITKDGLLSVNKY